MSAKRRNESDCLKEQSEAIGIFMRHGRQQGGWDDPSDYMDFEKVTVGKQDNPFWRRIWADHLVFAPK